MAKATGVPLAKVAARVLVGATLAELSVRVSASAGRRDRASILPPRHVSVKEAVLPFDRFPDVDSLLGPEMRSTGEVMGIDRTFGLAFAKSQIAAGNRLPGAASSSCRSPTATRSWADWGCCVRGAGFLSGGHGGDGGAPAGARDRGRHDRRQGR